ncbi:uncharacterized protein LOC124706099 [Lolium rigidum]|uniref:uncharacterized protein LOC124706099 n=1 Tax=Lolium rigidum TaxID=89674 RepID=UPI001F5DC09B|nr:uncharacterized protein LOC124706099 [Lolium rigidum]
MPSSYDSSTSSIEITGVTSTKGDANMDGCAALPRAAALSGPVAERYASSLRTQRVVDALCKKHGIPTAYTAQLARHRRACTPPPERSVCVYAHALEAGMRVPLPGFFSDVLTHFGLAPSQLAPNGWRILSGFVVLCHRAGVAPSLAVFRHFFLLVKFKLRGWYFFRGKDAAGTLFAGLPKSNKKWKDKFFFLTSPEPWTCPVRWDGPPSKASLGDPVLTSQEEKSVAKLLAASGSAVDLRTCLSETSLAAAFSSFLAGESQPPQASVRSTSTGAKGKRAHDLHGPSCVLDLGTDQPAKVKTEPGSRAPALSGKKRSREEANSNGEPCHSEMSSLPADPSSSATGLGVPPGFDPKPRHSPVQVTPAVDSTGGEAARKFPSTYESMLQTVSYASSYALELEKKLAEHVASKAELEKKLVVRDAELVSLRGQLKHGNSVPENAEFAAAVKQLLGSEEHAMRRAEHSLEVYKNWKGRYAARRT